MKFPSLIPATPPHLTAAVILFTAFVLLGAGCATTPKQIAEAPPVLAPPPSTKPEPVEPVAAPVLPPPAQAPVPVAQPVKVPATVLPTTPVHSTQSIRIESVPSGAMIVVDGRPVGRAPLDFPIESANNGFFKEPLVIRARFVAHDAASESVSVDERLGTLEKIPIAIVFSRDGVQRVIRQY